MSALVVSSQQPRKGSVHDPGRAVQRQVEAQSDMEIISAVLSGEAHAFRDLVRRYERDVYRTTLYLLKNESDAEDASQEAFIRAYRNLASFRAEAKFSTWLLGIALNEARDRIRRRKARRIVDLEEIAPDQTSGLAIRDQRKIPSEVLEQRELHYVLQHAIESLPQIYQEVVRLRTIDELSTKATAQALSSSTAAVKVRLYRARRMLQKQLTPYLSTPSARLKT